jgi:hypothetical protein
MVVSGPPHGNHDTARSEIVSTDRSGLARRVGPQDADSRCVGSHSRSASDNTARTSISCLEGIQRPESTADHRAHRLTAQGAPGTRLRVTNRVPRALDY